MKLALSIKIVALLAMAAFLLAAPPMSVASNDGHPDFGGDTWPTNTYKKNKRKKTEAKTCSSCRDATGLTKGTQSLVDIMTASNEVVFPVGDKAFRGFSSFFGSRPPPIPGASTDHGGVDISTGGKMGKEAPIYSPLPFRVISQRWGCPSYGKRHKKAKICTRKYKGSGKGGNRIVLEHPDPATGKFAPFGGTPHLTTTYLHLMDDKNCPYKLPRHVRTGALDQTKIMPAGSPFACAGNSGNSSGAHVHFEAKRFGTKINPLSLYPQKLLNKLYTKSRVENCRRNRKYCRKK